MSKRSQTTGLPKAGPEKTPPAKSQAKGTVAGKPAPSSKPLREYRSRAEREQEIQRYVIIGTAIISIAALVILIGAFAVDKIITPSQAVATINGHNISVADFQKRVRLERVLENEQLVNVVNLYSSIGYSTDQIQQVLQQEPYATMLKEMQVPDQMGSRVLSDMVEDQLVRDQAAQMGISVNDDDVQTQEGKMFGYNPQADLTTPTATPSPTVSPTPVVSPTPSPTPTSSPTPETTPTETPTPAASSTPQPTLDPTQKATEFFGNRDDFFKTVKQLTGMNDADIRAYFETQALRQAVRDAVSKDMTSTATQYNIRHILVATEDEANTVLASLNAGESFADLAKALSTDTGSGAQGGELGWSPLSAYVDPFADAARDAAIGAFIGPVKSDFGYHIIQVRAKEDRPLTDSQLNNARSKAFQDWLKGIHDTATADGSAQTYSVWAAHVPSDPPLSLTSG